MFPESFVLGQIVSFCDPNAQIYWRRSGENTSRARGTKAKISPPEVIRKIFFTVLSDFLFTRSFQCALASSHFGDKLMVEKCLWVQIEMTVDTER